MQKNLLTRNLFQEYHFQGGSEIRLSFSRLLFYIISGYVHVVEQDQNMVKMY